METTGEKSKMTSLEVKYDFERTSKHFLKSISEDLESESSSSINKILLANETCKIGETDKKSVWDQAFRDKFLNDSFKFSAPVFEKLLHLSLDCALAQICSSALPVILLTDAFDILPLEKCEEIFYMVEMKVTIWKQELFFNQSKNMLLRLCNDLLRRLSRSQNTVFCGRILLFLAKFFPFSERSGLNVVSEFNLDNFTSFGLKEDSLETSDCSANGKDLMEFDLNLNTDYNLYKKFWSLQDFFRNPNQCYTKVPWKTFCSHTNDVLSAFSTIKLDERRNRSKWEDTTEPEDISDKNESTTNAGNVQQYFAKYLTSQNLLELQLGDSNFRRYILLQFLIMFQYLDSPVKFKHESHKLSDEQLNWVTEVTEKVYQLLSDTPPNGTSFAESIRNILKREELWNNWKNDGCPEFKPSIQLNSTEVSKDAGNGEKKAPVVARPRRMKRSLGDQIREASKRKKCVIGNAELNRLWNLCPDNMEACRSKDRDFLPTLENYFEEAIEQLDPSVESQYKRVNEANFGWRALRLLARRSLHFFTHGNTPITKLPDYLETHVRKLAKDMQQTANALQNVKSTEPVEEAGDVEQMEPETDPVSTASEMEAAQEDTHVKTEEPEDGTDEEVVEKKPVLCTMSQLTLLAKQIGSNWKTLAPKLGFKKDEVEYFESETSDVTLQAAKMFQIWLENETDATPENLLYSLEGLGMQDSAKGIF
nr:EOG090X0324 [Scapholeberis mucronata]